MAQVLTTLGEIDERDVEFSMSQQPGTPHVFVFAHEGKYVGTQFPEARGTIVRRDVWCIQKVGHGAQSAQG